MHSAEAGSLRLVNQVAQLTLCEPAVRDDAGEMVLHLAEHVDGLPQPLAARDVRGRPGLPGRGVVGLEPDEGLLQQLVSKQRLGACGARDRRLDRKSVV